MKKKTLALVMAAAMMFSLVACGAKEEPAPAPAPRKCPFCCQVIDDKATRCPHCTSELPEEK